MKYRFGSYEIDPAERRLLRNGEELHLQPKTFDTLVLLIARRGRLVNKDELMTHLWPEQVVTEHSITRCIREVRKVLGDNPANSQFIETVPKAGYRFVATVEEIGHSQPAVKKETPKASILARWHPWALAIVIIVLALLTWLSLAPGTGERPTSIPVVAILPIENRSGDDDNELVLAGLVEDIRERLASTSEVAFTSGVSASALGNVDADQTDWPGALNADWLVSGYLKDGDKHQTLHLRMTPAGDPPGAEQQFRIESGDLIGLSDQIANHIADILGIKLPPQHFYLATAANVESLNAHHQYLLARGLIAQRNPKSIARAIQVLHEVLEVMPNHADAMAALGIAYMLSPDDFYPAGVAFERAEGLFRTALQTDPDTALAWAGRALAQLQQDGDLEQLGEYIDRALELNPYDADVLAWAANHAGSEGRIDDAFNYFQRALAVDPLHTTVNGNLSFNLAVQGRYEQATSLLDNVSVRLADHPALYYFTVTLATQIGDLQTALLLSQEAMAGWPKSSFYASQLAHVYSGLQMRQEAERWTEYAQSLLDDKIKIAGSSFEAAIAFNNLAEVQRLMDAALAHPEYDDDDPGHSSPWLLDLLVRGHGYLRDCANLQRYMALNFDSPPALEGRRGTFAFSASLGQWKAWCLQLEGKTVEAVQWLDKISDQFEFMKSRGLGDSTPYMYAEAMNLYLAGNTDASVDLLEDAIDVGWLNQGALEHDPRWDGLRQDPRFKNLLDRVRSKTTAIRQSVSEAGMVQDFNDKFEIALAEQKPG